MNFKIPFFYIIVSIISFYLLKIHQNSREEKYIEAINKLALQTCTTILKNASNSIQIKSIDFKKNEFIATFHTNVNDLETYNEQNGIKTQIKKIDKILENTRAFDPISIEIENKNTNKVICIKLKLDN